jgi:two-component system, cell cycle sensor histidine kinase PleC
MIHEETSIQSARRSRADADEQRTLALIVASFLVSTLCLAGGGIMLVRENRARRRRVEELEGLKRALETANRAKADFIAALNHELRSPLTSVAGFADLLAAQREALGTRGARYVESIRQSADHMLDLVNEILEFSQLEAGRLVLHASVIDMERLVEECAAMLRVRAEQRGVKLNCAVDPAAARFRGDARRCRQILVNLVTNAIKYTPAGGEVAVRVTLGADGLRIAVVDTGIGMAETDLRRVMEPYEQVETAENAAQAGTGLGLPLTRRLVELHGGELRLTSSPGNGTTAVALMPLEPRLAA